MGSFFEMECWWDQWRKKSLEFLRENQAINVSLPERKLNKKFSADHIEEFTLLKNHFNCFFALLNTREFHKNGILIQYFGIFILKVILLPACQFLINHHQTHCCNRKEPKVIISNAGGETCNLKVFLKICACRTGTKLNFEQKIVNVMLLEIMKTCELPALS